jgi:chemotaxis protein methyltransferase CheR
MVSTASADSAIRQWVDACRDQSWRNREDAAKALSAFSVDELFDRFVGIVDQTHDFAERNAALVWLERNTPDRTYQMYEALHNSENVLHLLNLLGRIGDPKIAPSLRGFLAHPDENIINATIETLGNIGNPISLPWLKEFLDLENPWFCFPAIRALGQIGSSESIPVLVELVEDEFLRPAVVQAIAQIGGLGAATELVRLWEKYDSPEDRAQTVAALGELWSRSTGIVRATSIDWPRVSGQDVLSEWMLQPDANSAKGVVALVLHNDPDWVAEQVVRQCHTDDWFSLVENMPSSVLQNISCTRLMRNPKASARLIAILVGRMNGSLEELAEDVLRDSNEVVRTSFTQALRSLPVVSERAELYLTELLWDRSIAVRAAARSHFEKVGIAAIEARLPHFFNYSRLEVVLEMLEAFPALFRDDVTRMIVESLERSAEQRSSAAGLKLRRMIQARDASAADSLQILEKKDTAVADQSFDLKSLTSIPLPLGDVDRDHFENILRTRAGLAASAAAFMLSRDDPRPQDEQFWSEFLSSDDLQIAMIATTKLRDCDVISASAQQQLERMLEHENLYVSYFAAEALYAHNKLDTWFVERYLNSDRWALKCIGFLVACNIHLAPEVEDEMLLSLQEDRKLVAGFAGLWVQKQKVGNSENQGHALKVLETAISVSPENVSAKFDEYVGLLKGRVVLHLIEEWVRSRIGIAYTDHRLSLLDMRLQPRVEALRLAGSEAYLMYLLTSPDRDKELRSLISRLTNNETFLFREQSQLDVLVNEIFPAILEKQPNIKVASAGCSSGEEAVSLVSLWSMQHSSQLEALRVFGLDIDLDILDKARAGRYGPNSFRRVDPLLQYRFFDAHEGVHIPKPSISKQISFRWANLFDGDTLGPKDSFDVILCRNVLIYFDDEGKHKVVTHLSERLRPGGYLCVGLSETLAHATLDLEPVRVGNVLMYQKPGADES